MVYISKFAEEIDSSKDDVFKALENVVNTWDKVKEIDEINETEQSVYFRYKTGGFNKCWIRVCLKEISDNKTKACYVLEWSANPGGNTSILDNTLHNIVSELHLQLLSGLGKDDLVKEFKSGQTKNRAITLLCVGVILIFVFVVFIMK